MTKKRGGQPNNKNAHKHGFYSKHFSKFESKALSELPLTDVAGEIGLVRVNIERFMEAYTKSLEDLNYESRLAGLRAITMAAGRIASLERIQAYANKNAKEANKFNEEIRKIEDAFAEEAEQVQK